ncbi:Protein mono-ADP-ribosyltransferase PARP16 [Pseudolycoriella hygida]|uniref:Protein mono-ADP-ribosyltransferase PARP16 n=1 Tax=Pseudolycoriella hygida TaxID=35572 RepID=A0A9Q0NFQ6_9DIPT|nr:Protein mono-ADP-ribosyltransferase PARP16 [Pseudolycoriella hygida]
MIKTVLEIVVDGLHVPREVYELRYSLFISAANRYFRKDENRSEVLEPFPTCFYDFTTKTRLNDSLKQCISSIPKLSEINYTISLPEETWALLSWIFTNPLKIEAVKQSEVSDYMSEVLREETKLSTIPQPSNHCIRFDITHEDPNLKKIFLAHKAKFGTFFAYHGSPRYNFHSIIHRGLRCSLSVGKGTYLTSHLETATLYSQEFSLSNDVNRCANDPIKYCVSIVEVVKHPSVTVTHNYDVDKTAKVLEECKFEVSSSKRHRYYVVNSDELMRLRHLLVYYKLW